MSQEAREFATKLEESLDENFPKGECAERGRALMVFAEAVLLFEQHLKSKQSIT